MFLGFGKKQKKQNKNFDLFKDGQQGAFPRWGRNILIAH